MKANVNGGSLIFALAILLFVSILISLFLTMNITYSKLSKKYKDYAEGVYKLKEGFKLGYYINEENYIGEEMNNTNNIEISKKLWGCYFQVTSNYKINSTKTISRIGLIGNELKKDYCLYLSNNNSKLSLSGNTFINGNCFLPEKGVGISYIEGKSYTKKKLVYGNVETSNSNLPNINQFIIQDNLLKLKGVFNPTKDSLVNVNELANTIIHNSFKNKTLVIKTNTNFTFDKSWNLSGNIILYSPYTIKIKKEATLENIIIYSKNIFIESGTNICSQLIAANKINIDSNSNLFYPSSILTLSDSSSITLHGNTNVNGTIISYSKVNNANNSISISKNSTVNGLIYNTNKTELKGKVFGKIISQKLYHTSPSTRYTNTLIDAEINNALLPIFYSHAPLLKEDNSTINVIKWLK